MKTSEVIIDIETYPEISPDMLKAMRSGIKPHSGIKDKEKIKADIAAKEKKLISKAALSPRTGRIVIVGVGVREEVKDADWQFQVLVDKTHNEGLLLETLDEIMSTVRTMKVITYNGKLFDLPFLAVRAMVHRLTLKYKWPIGAGSWHPQHVDMFDTLGKNGSLNEWGILLTGGGKKESGAMMSELVDQERWEEAEQHCLYDIKTLASIYDLYRTTVQTHRGR